MPLPLLVTSSCSAQGAYPLPVAAVERQDDRQRWEGEPRESAEGVESSGGRRERPEGSGRGQAVESLPGA